MWLNIFSLIIGYYKCIFYVIRFGSIYSKVIKVFLDKSLKFLSTNLKLINSIGFLFCHMGEDFFHEFFVPFQKTCFLKASLLISKIINKVKNFFRSIFLLFLLSSTKCISTPNIYISLLLNNKTSFNLENSTLMDLLYFVGIGNDFFISEKIEIDFHVFNKMLCLNYIT